MFCWKTTKIDTILQMVRETLQFAYMFHGLDICPVRKTMRKLSSASIVSLLLHNILFQIFKLFYHNCLKLLEFIIVHSVIAKVDIYVTFVFRRPEISINTVNTVRFYFWLIWLINYKKWTWISYFLIKFLNRCWKTKPCIMPKKQQKSYSINDQD